MSKKFQKEYALNGIIKLRSLISKNQANNIIKKINLIFCNIMKDKNLIKGRINIFNNPKKINVLKFKHNSIFLNLKLKTIQKFPEIYQIGSSKKIFKYLKKLGIKEPVYSTDPLIMMHHESTNMALGGDYAPFHQDWRSVQGSLNCIVLWIPLIDIIPRMGSITYIPGSHKEGLLPTQKHPWFREISSKYTEKFKDTEQIISKGDGFMFSSFLVHKSKENNSKKIRVSLQFRYNDLSEENYIKRGYPCNYIHAIPNKRILRKDIPSKTDILKIYK